MYTKQALREIGIQTELAPTYQEQLDQDGFFLVKNYFDEEECDRMATEFDRLSELEGNQGGHEVHIEPNASRISNIFNKTTEFDRCLSIEYLLQASQYLLGEFKVHGANLREPLHNGGHQKLHTDVPKKFSDDWWVSNSIIALDDITIENGPPRVVPGSHKWQPLNVAYVNIHDWEPKPLTTEEEARVPADLEAVYPGEQLITAPKGSVIVMNSALWHGGTLNKSGARRRVLHLTYTRRDLPQQLVQRNHLTEELYGRMSDAHRFLLDIEKLPDVPLDLLKSAGRNSTSDWWNPET